MQRAFIPITLAICVCLLATPTFSQHSSVSGDDLAGAPIIATRQAAIDARPFHREVNAQRIRQWMEIASQCTMDEFELFLSPCTHAEKQLIEKIERMPPPIVNRLHFEDLRAVLKNGQLSSYFEQERLNSRLKHTTPAIEDQLYGAYDCVFASIGPPDGSPRYGDVIIRLKDTVRERGWATPFSGMYFMETIRRKDAHQMQNLLAGEKLLSNRATDPLSLGFDDRLHFSHYVVTEKHWNKALAYQAILVARNADASPAGDEVRARFATLLSEADPYRFWKTFIPAREEDLTPQQAEARDPFGYLEAKFDDQIALDFATSIEVPAEKLPEVRAWPEAERFLHLVRAKASGVP